MTELQIGLIGLGGVVVVGVIAYNTWQEYQHQKLAERVLNDRHADVLLDGGEREEVTADERGDPRDPLQAAVTAPPTRFPANALPADGEGSAGALAHERIEPVFRFADEAPELAPFEAPVDPAPREGLRAPSSPPLAASPAPPAPAAAPAPSWTAAAETARDPRESAEPVHLLSPLIDYVAAFEAVEPAPAEHILEAQRDALAMIGKPIHWIGYNERSREWEGVVADGVSEYRKIRVGLQLVDRRGPVDESEVTAFHSAMHDLADELMAVVELPARQGALTAAATLDEFCASVDIQIGINVIAGGQVFLGTKLRALAEAAGMVITGDGRFVRCDDDGNVLYMLVNQEAAGFSVDSMKTMSTHGVTFLLDVPRVAHGERVFNQMIDLARRFAEVLHGVLVDDNRRPLSEGALEPIRRQVGQYQAMMAAHNLPAGGHLAQRMFS